MIVKIYPTISGHNWITVEDEGTILFDGMPHDETEWDIKQVLNTRPEDLPLLIGSLKSSLGNTVLSKSLIKKP